MFRTIVPLDDSYSFDAKIGKPQTAESNRKNCGLYCGMECTAMEINVLDFLKKNPSASHESIACEIGKSIRTAQSIAKTLKEKGLLVREGSRSKGYWIVNPIHKD